MRIVDFFANNRYIIAFNICGAKKMKRKENLPELTTELLNQAQSLQCIVGELSKLLGEFNTNFRAMYTAGKSASVTAPRIIPFPSHSFARTKTRLPSGCLSAMPGKTLPDGLADYRPLLQRNGLILLSWDKRITEMGERYTAYWVSSSGIPRFYASKAMLSDDFPYARPDHKSYAAEDGIEFYGQQAPVYIAHVAPELMMSNPHHAELRLTHIQILKEQGSTVDFNYKYLLKTDKEKNRDEPHNRIKKLITIMPDSF